MQKTQSYLAAKLDTIRKKEAFKFIFDSVIADGSLMSSGVISEKIKATLLEESKDWYNACYKFPAVEDIKRRLESGEALCGFITRDKPTTVCIPFGTSRSKINFIEISWNPDGGDSIELVGLHYFHMSISSNPLEATEIDKEQLPKMNKHNCTILPYKKRNEEFFNGHYTIITDEWSTIRSDGRIGTPELSRNLFGALL